jgi:hypothetical protein
MSAPDSTVILTCAHCGQQDDHPKVHVASTTGQDTVYHYDCLPYDLRGQDEYVDKVAALAATGVHGDDLRAQTYYADNTPEEK